MADDDLARLLALMAEHDLEELELEREGLRVRLRKRAAPAATAATSAPAATFATAEGLAPTATSAPATPEGAGDADEAGEADEGARLPRRPGRGGAGDADGAGEADGAYRGAGPGPAADAGAEGGEDDVRVIRAPIVGTAYRAPDPDAAPFVEVGAHVRKGQVLCLIEAMKLMHEIDAEEDGTVVAIFVENEQAVEYGERLLALAPGKPASQESAP